MANFFLNCESVIQVKAVNCGVEAPESVKIIVSAILSPAISSTARLNSIVDREFSPHEPQIPVLLR
jgi:hypothetical protein